MERAILGRDLLISRIGFGGHYRAVEEGFCEERDGNVDRALEERTVLVERAFAAGINFFDTTWRNEVALLGRVLAAPGIRDRVAVNGMVLGAIRGARWNGIGLADYFDRWLDAKLALLPGHRFDVLMINAIEEDFNRADGDLLLALLQARRSAGDCGLIGFSCHHPRFAREIADQYPDFEVIMVPYNFHNRAFEEAFADYAGGASFIAMKPLVWTEYGIPFCALNELPGVESYLGHRPDPTIAEKAVRFTRSNPLIQSVLCSVNTRVELEDLIRAGEGESTADDRNSLQDYERALGIAEGLPLLLAGLRRDNLRMNYFAVQHLGRVLGLRVPSFSPNEPGARERLLAFTPIIYSEIRRRGYGGLLDGLGQDGDGGEGNSRLE